MNSIKWLFFDVGGTLADESASFRLRVERTAALQHALGNSITCEEIEDAMQRAAKNGGSYFRGAMKTLGVTEYAPYDPTGEVLYPDVKETLAMLAKDHALGIIANQPRGTEKRLHAYGIGHLFSLILSSEEEGVEKPNAEIFLRALQRAACKPYEAVMIGDRPDNDIAPAKRLGMKTVRITQGLGGLMPVKTDEEAADATISRLSELLSILKDI